MEHLFVYGSLAQGRKNAYILEKIGGNWRPASVFGRLVNRGWGAELGYPGLILYKKGQKINGSLFSSPNLKEHWKWLDHFEGTEYERIIAEVLVGNEIMNAFMYILKQ